MSLEARNVSVTLQGHCILNDVDLKVDDGGLLAVLGPNGSGKSTLTRVLSGEVRPASGQVRLDGRCLAEIPRREAARSLAVVAQRSTMPPLISVIEHVWLGRYPHRRWLAGPTRGDRDAVERAIAACDLGAILDRPVEVLSGGERQRVRIATAMAQSASNLILDEPLTGLDIEHQLDLLHMLLRINREQRVSVLVVLHDLDHAARFFPRIALLRNGRLVADGTPSEVLCGDAMESVFRVDGCLSRDQRRGQSVVVCSRLRERADHAASTDEHPGSPCLSPAVGERPPPVVAIHARGFEPRATPHSQEPLHASAQDPIVDTSMPSPRSGGVPRRAAARDDGRRRGPGW